ncbi:ParA family protein [Okeania sp. SIO2B9]|uniref:tyrosine-protein kinase family protein n=1 Tax=Okeania sp. SIO2B9 TaxID=2607782 RepID=UPI00142987FB|nr:ParA family protein [Okeania sp. SIO2B9]NES91291.1 ParA family protein [Okeania sp. SIO2B9]
MTDRKALMQQIQEHLNQSLLPEDSQVKVKVKRTSIGWLKILIITSLFQEQSLEEREQKIDEILVGIDFHLSKYPILSYDLLTPEEATEQPPEYTQIQLPLWSDILMSPEPEEPKESDEEDVFETPLIATFYSFRGGVGRSTALGLVAGILATEKKRRVVIVDFDLEAPGISILLESDIEQIDRENYGVLDYLYQRFLTPKENFPPIESCIYQVELKARGELFLVPVGEYNENYIHRLAELDRGTLQAFYRRENNPVEQLIEDIKEQLNPDVILIDARPGFNDTSAIALLDLADLGIICFSPTDQSFKGLSWIVQTVSKQCQYRGKPDLRFVLTPMPAVAAEQRQIWISKVEDWIEENWGLSSGITVGELYYEINYNPNISTLSSLVNNLPKSLLDNYLPIAEVIDASLPDVQLGITTDSIVQKPTKTTILYELNFVAATAQEIEPEKIPEIFQRTEDFPKFLSDKNWLIRGAKGTGKSILFRLFVEQPEEAKKLASYYLDISNVNFVAGHGKPTIKSSILEGGALGSYEREVGNDYWKDFWLNYALLQLCFSLPELHSLPNIDDNLKALITTEKPRSADIVSWLVEQAKSSTASLETFDQIQDINSWLQQNNRRVWLLYDELDVGFGSNQKDYQRRRKALEALLAWWLESGIDLKYIVPKIFLREDIWNQLNFTNKGHYVSGRSLELKWEEADLWRLILRQFMNNSRSLKQTINEELGVKLERLENIELEQLRKSLFPLWGEKMGSGNKSYIHNWVRKRTADSQDNRFPRSLILLLEEAVKIEKSQSREYTTDERILRPKSLIDALPEVSKQRVNEVRNEYPELEKLLDKLQGERSPIDENRLTQIWEIEGTELTTRLKEMIDAGIFQEYLRRKDPSQTARVYSVAELYLSGLGMTRKGQR